MYFIWCSARSLFSLAGFVLLRYQTPVYIWKKTLLWVQTDVCTCVCARVCVYRNRNFYSSHLSCVDVCVWYAMWFFEIHLWVLCFVILFVIYATFLCIFCVISQGTCTEGLCVKRMIYFLSNKRIMKTLLLFMHGDSFSLGFLVKYRLQIVGLINLCSSSFNFSVARTPCSI